MILILLRFSIRKVRILNLILFSILLLVSRILCVCSPLRLLRYYLVHLLRYYLVHLTLIPSAFLRGRQSRQHFNAIPYNITGSCCEMLFRSWPNVRNILQHPKFSQQKSDHFQTWSNTTQHLATCGNILLQGGQRCATLHTTILQDIMLKCCAGHVGCLVPFSLILFEIVTFLYDTIDFNLSSLPLLPYVSTVRTLNLLLSSIAALVFRELWFNPTLIVDMYRTHFEFNSLLVSCVSFSSLRVKLVQRLLI